MRLCYVYDVYVFFFLANIQVLETVSGKKICIMQCILPRDSKITHSFCLFVISHVIKKLLLSAFDKLLQNDRTLFMGSICINIFFSAITKYMKVIQHNNNDSKPKKKIFAQPVGKKTSFLSSPRFLSYFAKQTRHLHEWGELSRD